jgi:hypothetical protein
MFYRFDPECRGETCSGSKENNRRDKLLYGFEKSMALLFATTLATMV